MANATVFASAQTNPGGTGSTITVTLPTHAVGDEIRISIGNTGNTLWAGNPAGWERINQTPIGTATNGLIGTWFRHRVVSGDSLPLANPTFTLGATVTRMAIARTIRGADLEGINALPEWSARAFNSGTANPIRPASVTTLAPEMLVIVDYFQRAATNAPDQTNYTEDQQIIISGTLVGNATERIVTDPRTVLSSQDASPTSGVRWVAGIVCIPSPDYVYYRSATQATSASALNVSPAIPLGTSANDTAGRRDLMVLTAKAAGVVGITMQDSAWREIPDWTKTTSGNGASVKKFWKFAQGGDSTQVNRATTGAISASLTTYRNTRQTNPIANAGAKQIASGTTSTWDDWQRRNDDSTVTFSCVADGAPTYTTPAAASERSDANGIVCADRCYGAAGVTPSAAFTLSAANASLVGTLELIAVSQPSSPQLPNTHRSVKADSGVSTGERIR